MKALLKHYDIYNNTTISTNVISTQCSYYGLHPLLSKCAIECVRDDVMCSSPVMNTSIILI